MPSMLPNFSASQHNPIYYNLISDVILDPRQLSANRQPKQVLFATLQALPLSIFFSYLLFIYFFFLSSVKQKQKKVSLSQLPGTLAGPDLRLPEVKATSVRK